MRAGLVGLILILISNVGSAAEYIVRFRGDTAKGIKALKELDGFQSVKTFIPQLNMAVIKGQGLPVSRIGEKSAGEILYIARNGRVRLVSNDSVPTLSQMESEAGGTWGIKASNTFEAWKITQGDRKIVVAVSDTGTFMKHFDIGDNIWVNPGESGKDANGKDKSKNKIDDDGNGYIDDVNGYNFETNSPSPNENHYHGTHVAGTIGAVGGNKSGISGVNWYTSIMTVKFLGADGSGTDEAAIKTIVYAADNGARVINCSWGSDEANPALYDAIKYAMDKGMLVVAAAGNDSSNADKTPMYPAAYDLDNIVSVAASYNDKGELAGFSNYGKVSVDIVAPGDTIYSLDTPLRNTVSKGWFQYLSGTSMASPHVAGAAALMLAANPNLKWNEVKAILLETSTKKTFLTDKVSSGGFLNVGEAVKKAKFLADRTH